ncbi:hypothetical protein H7849_11765 [Alloacidobacterium dinghuense]|uniref:Uncharacterized protein n=1 Tax=Alloacidobacterium dinghuense TaxID=2763107 RepID=A0A7G8BPN2_9BACT|nr:hypothetical protein [Alloacidobacterium dinghuense]QNI34502.1 hypothetical protein H7849_11765 [Alloacidobacterium dinghuense]
MQNSLFETRTPEQLMQEREDLVDQQVLNLLCGRTQFPVTEQQRHILELLRYRRGRSKAIKISEISSRLNLSARFVKDMVRSLVVDFKLQIGASRDGADGGYYLVMSDEEALDTARPYIEEGIAMFKRAQVFVGTRAILELRGQLSIEEETHSGGQQ